MLVRGSIWPLCGACHTSTLFLKQQIYGRPSTKTTTFLMVDAKSKKTKLVNGVFHVVRVNRSFLLNRNILLFSKKSANFKHTKIANIIMWEFGLLFLLPYIFSSPIQRKIRQIEEIGKGPLCDSQNKTEFNSVLYMNASICIDFCHSIRLDTPGYHTYIDISVHFIKNLQISEKDNNKHIYWTAFALRACAQ